MITIKNLELYFNIKNESIILERYLILKQGIMLRKQKDYTYCNYDGFKDNTLKKEYNGYDIKDIIDLPFNKIIVNFPNKETDNMLKKLYILYLLFYLEGTPLKLKKNTGYTLLVLSLHKSLSQRFLINIRLFTDKQWTSKTNIIDLKDYKEGFYINFKLNNKVLTIA